MKELIILIVGNYFLTLFIIGLLAAFISLKRKPKPVAKNIIWEKFFSFYLLFAIGINGIVNFIFHVVARIQNTIY